MKIRIEQSAGRFVIRHFCEVLGRRHTWAETFTTAEAAFRFALQNGFRPGEIAIVK